MADPTRRTSLAGRLLAVFAVSFVVVLVVAGYFIERAERSALAEELEAGLIQQARSLISVLPTGAGAIPDWVDRVAGAADARITVVDISGEVVADSFADPQTMDNHLSRPEIMAAVEEGLGSSLRLSATTDFSQLYVAVSDGDRILRLSVPQNTVTAHVRALRGKLFALVAIAGIVGIAIVALVARRLANPMTELALAAERIAAGNLEVAAPRSSVAELDRIGRSIGDMAVELGNRLMDLDDQRATLALVLDTLPQGVLFVDSDDSIAFSNRSLSTLLGTVASTLAGVTPFRVQEAVRTARTSGQVIFDMEHGRPVRVIEVVVSAVPEGRVLVVVSDVTESRRINDIRRDFVTNASHELKTPVSSILAAAEALQLALDRAPDRAPGFASQIERSAGSLARLVSDLLDLSRLEGGEGHHQAVDLMPLLRSQVNRLVELAEDRSVEVRILDSDEVQIDGSARDLALAMRNLIDNAIRYSEAGETVDVGLAKTDGEAVFTVTDRGAGIPQRDLDRIFERFYRVDEARSRATGGTGLGLSIVRHVVESHYGTIDVTSELGAGSTFKLRLPLKTPT